MEKKFNKAGYEAPKMEATSFVTENGYAGSGGGGGKGGTTTKFNNVPITWPGA